MPIHNIFCSDLQWLRVDQDHTVCCNRCWPYGSWDPLPVLMLQPLLTIRVVWSSTGSLAATVADHTGRVVLYLYSCCNRYWQYGSCGPLPVLLLQPLLTVRVVGSSTRTLAATVADHMGRGHYINARLLASPPHFLSRINSNESDVSIGRNKSLSFSICNDHRDLIRSHCS